jgi:ABC-2 type transport system permease protein
MLATALRMDVSWGNGPMNMLAVLVNVLSGELFPLQLWPDFMQGFLMIQPFAGHFDIPLRLYTGTMEPNAAAGAIGLQLFWTAVFILLGRVIMARRLKRVVVQGG